jgi:PAS domain S-box-containing protein
LQGVRSALIVPLVYDKETFGFLGLDSCQPNVPEPRGKADSFKVISAIFVSALMRKKAEEALVQERNFAQQIMATMGQGVMTTTVEGVLAYVNPACANMLGYEPKELIGKTALEFTHPEGFPRLIQAQMQNLDGNTSSYEARLIKADGSPLYVLVNGVPNYDHRGKIIGSIATITDLTERRTAEARMKENAEEVKEIYQAAIQLFKPSRVGELAEQIAAITIEQLGFDACGVLLLQDPIKLNTDRLTIRPIKDDNHLMWLARYGRFYNSVDDKIPVTGGGLVAAAVRHGETIYAPDVTQDPRYLPDNTYAQSELIIPLRAYNQIIGAIDLQSPHINGFDERAQRIISIFAEHAGLALETVRLYEKLQEHAQALETQINERKKIEQALRASEQRYKQFVENATDIIYRTDANGQLIYANPVTIRTLGYDKEADLIGQHYSVFVQPDFHEKLNKVHSIHQTKQLPNSYHEFIALTQNGQQIWLGQNVQPIMEHGQIIGYQALARDITQRRQTEEVLRSQSYELNATNAKLAQALRTKDEFLANMSHELRTPLNAILGKSEIMLEGIHGPLTDKQASSLRVIEESGRHLLELINDILDMTKIEAGKITLDIQEISLPILCESSLQFVRQMAHKKQVKLQASIDHSLTTCHADERRLKQILINLLSNAVKFTPAGGEVGLNVLADAEKEAIQFQVWDTGIGISTDNMGQLFKPFVQLDSSLARAHDGTGLGLSLVYRLTEIHGGSVALESQPNLGSCFTVTLPQKPQVSFTCLLEKAKSDRQRYEALSNSKQQYFPGKEPLILLVEDNKTNIETVAEYLPIWGFRLTIAHNGNEALIKAREEKPDLILMDVQIPEMDGLTAVRQLRQEACSKDVPIIALTALAMRGDREQCLDAGVNEYISKPIQLRQLVMLINQLLNKSRADEKEPQNV